MEQSLSYQLSSTSKPERGNGGSVLDFGTWLLDRNVAFSVQDHHLVVGEITWTQGWMLDLAIITLQLKDALDLIVPVLTQEHIPFKIVRTIELARTVLNGEMGFSELGKVITVYPSAEKLLKVTRKIIEITIPFKGPRILTDAHLGGTVYTRYGACHAIEKTNNAGITAKYIYNPQGELIPEPMHIPFKLPDGIVWPFDDIKPYKEFQPQTTLLDKYRPMGVLKNDVKGWVRKGMWLKKLYYIKWVVIKEGKKGMSADSFGRDMSDRLQWQYEIHKDLEGKISLPVVHDLFEENGDTYLVMDLIRGISFEKIIVETLQGRLWHHLDSHSKENIIGYCIKILTIIGQMHSQGYIHRDITPNNFLIDKQGAVWLIDLELAYSTTKRKPIPAFRLGTPGYMSAEQIETLRPTVAQDIYSLGCLLISAITGLFPGGFATSNEDELRNQLQFFMPDEELVNLLSQCLSVNASKRSQVADLKTTLAKVDTRRTAPGVAGLFNGSDTFRERLEKTIAKALRALSTQSMTNKEGLWFCKTTQMQGLSYSHQEAFSVSSGLYDGLSGVIYLLAQAHKAGFNVDHCFPSIEKSLFYIRNHATQLPIGYYHGRAGMATALTIARQNNLITDADISYKEINSWLTKISVAPNAPINTLTSLGMAILKVTTVTGDMELKGNLDQIIGYIVFKQLKDGSWCSDESEKSKIHKLTGLAGGVAGTVCLLLEYQHKFGDFPHLQKVTRKALAWLMAQAKSKNELIRWPASNKSKLFLSSLQDGATGIAYCFLKAFLFLGDPQYRDLASKTLRANNPHPVVRNISLANGLVGLGEIYLEAAKILGDNEWHHRAGWIAQLLTHYYRLQDDGSICWLTGGTSKSIPGLMLGNSGVIHFLLRYARPKLLDHVVLV